MHAESIPTTQVRYALVMGEEMASTERAAMNDLADLIEQMTGRRPRVYRGANDVAAIEEGVILALGTPDSNPLIARLSDGGALRFHELGEQGYRVESLTRGDKAIVVLGGKTSIGAMYAAYSYLERSCGVGFFDDGNRVPQLAGLPVSGLSYGEQPQFAYRDWLHHAVWTRPYDRSFQLWGFDDWKRMIDWMRRKKLNLLTLFHDEGTFLWGDAIFRAFPEIPKTAQTLHHYTMMPEYRTELNQRIFGYARESGVRIAYNLFYSQVPDFFAAYHPELTYHQLQMGNLGICASQPECASVMARFWGEIVDLYGTDDFHQYHVCPYQHEAPLCDQFETRVEPTRQAYEVLQAIDPDTHMFVESWCWSYGQEIKTPELSLREWAEFQAVLPPEVGVVDWDKVARTWRSNPSGEAYGWFEPREWISLHHLTMEWAWPPDYGWHPLESSIKAIQTAVEHNAVGLSTFHILARTNELPSYVFAEMAWNPNRSQAEMIETYLNLRFRPESVDALEKSFEANFAAVTKDALLVANGQVSCWPAETELAERIRLRRFKPLAPMGTAYPDRRESNATDAWIDERLTDFRYRYGKAQEAKAWADSVARNEAGNPFYVRYLWELNYLLNRWDGLIEFYEAYLSDKTAVAAGEHFHHAMAAFYRIRGQFQADKGIKMEAIQELAPEVKYNPTFLDEWRVTFWREGEPIRHHNVVWEFFPEYEAKLLSMNPVQVRQ